MWICPRNWAKNRKSGRSPRSRPLRSWPGPAAAGVLDVAGSGLVRENTWLCSGERYRLNAGGRSNVLSYGQKKGGGWKFDTPKTKKSCRTITLPRAVLVNLRATAHASSRNGIHLGHPTEERAGPRIHRHIGRCHLRAPPHYPHFQTGSKA